MTFPDFTQIAYEDLPDAGPRPDLAREPWSTPEGIAVKPRYSAADIEGLDHLGGMPGLAPFVRGPYPTMYNDQPLDDPPVCRVLHGGGLQRLLPAQSGCGTERVVGRLRSRDPSGLRQRPPACGRRCGHGRRGDRLHSGYGDAVQRHTAGSDERVHDHERRRSAGPGALYRGGGGAGRRPRQAFRHDPERYPQRIHGAQHLHLPARPLHAHHLRHLRLHGQGDA